MDKFWSDLSEVFSSDRYVEEFLVGTWESVYSTVVATLVAFLLGLVLAVLLVVGRPGGVRPLPGVVMKGLNIAINVLRSVPFLILMLFVGPLSLVLVGTQIGTIASIPPLVVAAAPVVARLLETSLQEVDSGVIEAAQAMGCTPFQIIRKVILPECLPALVSCFTTSFITILSYGAMAGAIGGGGLGRIAINYGYHRNNLAVGLVATVIIVILVQIAQTIGSIVSLRVDHKGRGRKARCRVGLDEDATREDG